MPRRNLILIVVSAILSLACYRTSARNPYGRYFEEVMEQIDSRYVQDVDRQALFDAAVDGMMRELDENSAFIGRTDAPEFTQALEGKFGGIGIEVSHDEEADVLTVISPIVDTPAYKAGILSGDQILKIDGQSTAGLKLQDAVHLMRGPVGKEVKLTVLHKGDEKPVDLTIPRAIIKVDSVIGDTRDAEGKRSFTLEGHPQLGYIRITTFGNETSTEMAAALEQVHASGAKALILDLRSNPGGLLNTAVEIADMFLDDGLIVSIKGRNHELREQHSATPSNTICRLPMAVLINGYSASASEILAASLQDHGRAVIIGERSYGKGTVQSVIEVEGGRSVLKLTTADYWRPSNRNIHRHKDAAESDEWGVTPNEGFVVPMTDEEIRDLARERQERDMNRRSANPEEADESSLKPLLDYDPQLKRAVEYLESQLAPSLPANAA